MEFLLKLVDMIGGFDGIKKTFDGKKTYLACAATILGGLFWICWTLYLFGQKKIDANTAYVQITVCWAALASAVKSIFQRMATAKHDRLLKIAIEAQAVQTQPPTGAQPAPASNQGGTKP